MPSSSTPRQYFKAPALSIRGIGTALPDTCVTQAESLKIAQALAGMNEEQADFLPSLYRQTTIARRHLAFDRAVVRDLLGGTRHSGSVFLPGNEPAGPTTGQRMRHYVEQASPLAVRAARAALADAGLPPGAFTHLITVSCTGFSAPGVDVELVKRLGLSPAIERTHVGFMGCHGVFNGLRVARGFAGAGPAARVLLCAVELCSVHFHYSWNPKRMVANALFADGAAALAGTGTEEQGQCWQVAGSGAYLFPDSECAMTWDIGDHGFEMTLATKVPELIAKNLRPWFVEWLKDHTLRIEDVGSWAVHPGGPKILAAVEEALGLTRDATAVSYEVLAECGNMSSATILFIIERLRKRSARLPCVALGFGPGLTVEATLFQ